MTTDHTGQHQRSLGARDGAHDGLPEAVCEVTAIGAAHENSVGDLCAAAAQ
jgi:hypothetical protein